MTFHGVLLRVQRCILLSSRKQRWIGQSYRPLTDCPLDMLSGCELVFSTRPSMYFVCINGSLPCHQPCSGLPGLEQKNACWKQCLRLPILFCQCTNYCKCWGLRSSEVRRLNRSHRDREGKRARTLQQERRRMRRGRGRKEVQEDPFPLRSTQN